MTTLMMKLVTIMTMVMHDDYDDYHDDYDDNYDDYDDNHGDDNDNSYDNVHDDFDIPTSMISDLMATLETGSLDFCRSP